MTRWSNDRRARGMRLRAPPPECRCDRAADRRRAPCTAAHATLRTYTPSADLHRNRTGIPALPCAHSTLTAQKPEKPEFRREPRTWGDHLRRQRLKRGLKQIELAGVLGVSEMT